MWPNDDLRSAFVVGAVWEIYNSGKDLLSAAEEHYPDGKPPIINIGMVLKDGLVISDKVTINLFQYWESCAKVKTELIIDHYTATRTLAEALESQYWAHFYVEPDGHIIQRVPVGVWAPHAGVSEWGGRYDLNKFSVGIEHVNYGRLSKTDDGWCRDGVCFPENEILRTKHKLESGIYGWPLFEDPQIQSSRELHKCLFEHQKWIDIVGHEDVCAKVDPGPAFPLKEFKELFYGPETDCDFIISRWWQGNDIGAGGVSLKSLPYDWSPSVKWYPAGTTVRKLAWSGRWVRVESKEGKIGWVMEKYLRRII